MVAIILILVCLCVCIVVKMIHGCVQNEVKHDVETNNVFIKSFLSSDDYLAKLYASRSKLNEFKIMSIEQLTSKKSIRQYLRLQDRSLGKLIDCFKCHKAAKLMKQNANIQYLMDLERTCLHHTYCSTCPCEGTCHTI